MSPNMERWCQSVLDGHIISNKSNGHTRHCLVNYIRSKEIIPYICTDCRCNPLHNNKPLVLQLDHTDGNPTNNTIANLRWLCPNCHSQTATFAGRNSTGQRSSRAIICEVCSAEVNNGVGRYNKKFCSRECSAKSRHRKDWHNINIDAAIKEYGITVLEQMWKVSNVAIYRQRNKQLQKIIIRG